MILFDEILLVVLRVVEIKFSIVKNNKTVIIIVFKLICYILRKYNRTLKISMILHKEEDKKEDKEEDK